MTLAARGRNFYSDFTVYGVGAAANTAIEMSGSSKSGINYTDASGSYPIVRDDDIFANGKVWDSGGVGDVVKFTAIDASQITLGYSAPGFIKISFATTGKQIEVRLIRVNDH